MPAPKRNYGNLEDPLPPKDVRQLGLSLVDRNMFQQLADQAQMYANAKREASKLMEEATGKLKELLKKADPGRSKIVAGTVEMSYYPQERRSLKAELLLENGVTPSIINKSTVVSTSWALRIEGSE